MDVQADAIECAGFGQLDLAGIKTKKGAEQEHGMGSVKARWNASSTEKGAVPGADSHLRTTHFVRTVWIAQRDLTEIAGNFLLVGRI